MKHYSSKISLICNKRGVYDIDPSKGCSSGMLNNPKGCYDDCYAARAAIKYNYDFSKTILRYFDDENHRKRIIRQINNIDMPFIRMGCSGDPSENWEHTLRICLDIKDCKKKQLSSQSIGIN